MMTTGNIINLHNKTIHYGTVHVKDGRISGIDILDTEQPDEPYILPGFVDAHVHVESSLLTPAQFARLAVVHGTVATVSDPHEIGNVLGVPGVDYMLRDGDRVPFKFCFGAPSCVPATTFETAGATIGVEDIRDLLARPDIGYLAEMMNFPGVLHHDPEVMAKIALAKTAGKPIDGHAPGLQADAAQQYIDAGMTTDHECFTYEEGLDKAQRGMNILIREGSAAKNFDALIPLLSQFPGQIMFCSDDKHPDTLAEGHINQLVVRALQAGHSLWHVLRAACLNPVIHYKLNVGLLRLGDTADFIVVDNLHEFRVQQTLIDGQVVAANGQTKIPDLRSEHPNQWGCDPKRVEEFAAFCSDASTASKAAPTLRVIEALDGQLITNELHLEPALQNGQFMADVSRDILKIVVVNRYADEPPAIGFIKNFGLQQGAIASSVGHDSHNITAVGCDDESLCRAVNLVIEAQGGLSAVGLMNSGSQKMNGTNKGINGVFSSVHSVAFIDKILSLPVAGLMTDDDGYDVARQYATLDQFVKNELGSTLSAPFMTLSFMALLVIPKLKLSNKGLFDGGGFRFVSLSI